MQSASRLLFTDGFWSTLEVEIVRMVMRKGMWRVRGLRLEITRSMEGWVDEYFCEGGNQNGLRLIREWQD